MAATIQNIELPKKPRARDTSGNNNHGEIYSGRGLEFDGVSDYIHTPLDGNTAVFGDQSDFEVTISFWYNTSAASSDTRGVIQWARWSVVDGSPFILFKQNNNGVLQYYVDEAFSTLSHVFQDETWYRIVLTRTASDNTWRSYVNGIADTVYDDSGSPALQANADSVFFGTGYGGYFAGMLSDAQVWNKAFTQTDVTYDYLNPESLALNASGSALTEGNLKLWYPMQDGHRGQQSYILDGANTGLGDELVNDGNFETDTAASTTGTYWNTGEGWVIENDALVVAEASSASYTTQTNVGEAGKLYKVIVDVEVTAGTTYLYYAVGQTYKTITSTGVYTYYITWTGNTELGLYKSNTFVGKWNSVSLKAVNDKHHATTVFYGDDLWNKADNDVDTWVATAATSVASSEVAIGGTTDGVKLIYGSQGGNHSSYAQFSSSKFLSEDLVVGREYTVSGLFATDVVGNTNAPGVAVYASGFNYPTGFASAAANIIPATNLVLNPGFETAGGGGADIWANWTEAAGSGTLANATSGMHNGADCASLTTVSGNLCNILQQITVVANTTYLASYWSKNANASAAGDARHRVLNTSDGDSSIVASVNSGSETADWVQTYFQFTTPTGCTAIKYGVISPSGNYEVLVDDFMLTAFLEREITFTATTTTGDYLAALNIPSTAANDLISQIDDKNSIFDESSINSSSGWQSYVGSGGTSVVSYDATDDEVTFSTTTNGAIEGMKLEDENYTALEIGRTYTVKINMRAASGTPTVKVRLGLSNIVTDAITTSDVDYNFSVTPVDITSSLLVYLQDTTGIDITVSKVEIFPHCNLYVDDLSFKEVGVASGWTDADQQLHIPQTALQSYNELAWFEGFDNCHVELGSSIDTGSNNWSISFWLYEQENATTFSWPIGTGSTRSILTKKSNVRHLNFRDSSSGYHGLSDLVDGSSIYSMPLGKWNHFVIAATGDTSMQAYINGVKQTLNPSVSDTTLVLLHFMEGYSGNYFPIGSITEIAYYNTILTDANALDLFNDGKAKSALEASGSAGLVGYWRNNGLSEWKDLKGSNDGTPTSLTETILIPEGVDTTRDSQGFLMNKKRSTSSLNLTTNTIADGIGDGGRVTIPGRIDLGTDDFSISFWAYKFQDWNEQWVISQYQDGNNRWYIRGTGNPPTFQLYTVAAGNVVLADADVTDLDGANYMENWMHVTLVVDRDSYIKWYINGDLTSTGTVDGSGDEASGQEGVSLTLDADVEIGWFELSSFDDHHFNGQIDNVLIYNTALSATEIIRNYKATKGSHRN